MKMVISNKRHELFAGRLKTRIGRHGAEYLSEDCIRYEYFTALLETEKCNSCDLLLEYPHPHSKYEKRKIDCVVMRRPGKAVEALEFKYFADGKLSTKPRLSAMGGLFADCYRLLDTDIPQKIIVLVSTGKMTDYINNPKNRFDFLFDESCSRKEREIEAAFYKKIGGTFISEIRKKTYPKFSPFAFFIKRIFTERENDYTLAVFNIRK